MAVDLKYGRVTLEHGSVGEDEPVVVLRARDLLIPKLLAYYRLFCWKARSPRHHLKLIDRNIAVIERWQERHAERVTVPSSDRMLDQEQGPSDA